MCIIFHKKKGVQLDKETLEDMAFLNPDGFGITWLDTGTTNWTREDHVAVKWGLSKRPFVLHMRYATVGKKNLANCHPFEAGQHGKLYMNGTIKGFADEDKTDTEQLAAVIANIDDPTELLESFEARFCLVDDDCNVTRYGDWIEHDGYWTSKEVDTWFGHGGSDIQTYSPERHLVAVYGTLKSGFRNDYHLDGATFVDWGFTQERHRLVISGLPFLIEGTDDFERGENVEVEIYSVSSETLARLDRLEGHPHFYKRKKTPIRSHGSKTTGRILMHCWVYFVDESYDSQTGEYQTEFHDDQDVYMIDMDQDVAPFHSDDEANAHDDGDDFINATSYGSH